MTERPLIRIEWYIRSHPGCTVDDVKAAFKSLKAPGYVEAQVWELVRDNVVDRESGTVRTGDDGYPVVGVRLYHRMTYRGPREERGPSLDVEDEPEEANPFGVDVEGRTVDRLALDFASKVKREASRPVSIKIGSRYSSLANMIKGFDVIGIDALVLFNRFYRPDIDIESMTLSQAANPLSSSHEYAESLRWIALMSGEVKCDLCASTGIHDGETMIKMLLAGASACQICTAALKDLSIIRTMCDTLSAWMSRHGFSSISDFRGRLAQENMEETGLWERTQYIKKLSGSN